MTNIRKEIETGIINTDDSGNEITCPVTLDIFQKIDEKELKCIVNEMKSKDCSLDPVPTWLVKSCFEELKHVLLYIINRSLVTDNTCPNNT